ncbi:MAG TPA: HAD-IA family hydrolase [Thermoplasmata archaeon]|nr:HAD-IA family hydrolase [Thermoplasmata archaeon]
MRREVIRIAETRGVTPGHLSLRDPIPKILEAALSELSLGGVPEGDRFRFESEVNEAIDKIELEALPRTKPQPGAADLLRALTARGYRLAVLTRSSEVFCRAALQRTGLKEYFPNLRTRSSPGPAKPSPESLLLLLHEMGVPLDRAVFVGDHPFDGECATRARVRFLGVAAPGAPGSELAERLKRSGALAVAPNLAGIGRILGVAAPEAPAPGAGA